MSRKKAMVQAPPSAASVPPAEPPEPPPLVDILYRIDENRAYTVLWSKTDSWGASWKVHFEGDVKSTLIILKNGKINLEKE